MAGIINNTKRHDKIIAHSSSNFKSRYYADKGPKDIRCHSVCSL